MITERSHSIILIKMKRKAAITNLKYKFSCSSITEVQESGKLISCIWQNILHLTEDRSYKNNDGKNQSGLDQHFQ